MNEKIDKAIEQIIECRDRIDREPEWLILNLTTLGYAAETLSTATSEVVAELLSQKLQAAMSKQPTEIDTD